MRSRRLAEWADRVGSLPDSVEQRLRVLAAWRIGGWVADQIARAKGCTVRMLAEVAAGVLGRPGEAARVQGLLVYRLRDRLGLETHPSWEARYEAHQDWAFRCRNGAAVEDWGVAEEACS